MSFNNFKVNNKYDIEFDLTNVSLALTNSLRRCMLSEVPVLIFSDDWNDDPDKRSININTNTSGIHNEYLSHRLSLVPICMHSSSLISPVQTIFNTDKNIREFNCDNSNIFSIKKKNNTTSITQFNNKIEEQKLKILQQIEILNTNTSIKEDLKLKILSDANLDIEFLDSKKTDTNLPIMSSDILCNDEMNTDIFNKNVISNDYIFLDILKYNYNNPEEGEEVDVSMTLTVNNASKKSQYCPTGTVSLSYNIDESKSEKVFELKIEYINQERLNKGLDMLDDLEIAKLKNSYNLLDKERNYVSDDYNEPINFHFRIESLGFLHSSQLFYDSIKLLEIKLFDIVNCFTLNNYTINYTNKIEVKLDNNLENEFIFINNENHTIGNLINSYLTNISRNSKLIELCGYKMPHPLEQIIWFNIVLNDKYTNLQYLKLYKNYLKLKQEPPDDFDVISNFKMLIFINCICKIIKDLKNLLREYKKETIYTKNNEKLDIYNFNNPDNDVLLNYPSFNNNDDEKIFKFGHINFSLNDLDLDINDISPPKKIKK